MNDQTKSKPFKVLLIVLGCFFGLGALVNLGLFLFGLYGFSKDYSTNDLSRYEAFLTTDEDYKMAVDVMPELDICGGYLDGTVAVREHYSFYPYISYSLFLHYDEAEYVQQCAAIEERYDFKTEANACFQDVDADLYGFAIRAVQINDVKETGTCMFVGMNEEKHCIFYAFFEDHELDYIEDLNDTMTEMFYFPKEYR